MTDILYLFLLGSGFLFLVIVPLSVLIFTKSSINWIKDKFSIKEFHWSYLAIGSGVVFVLITPLLPLFFVEFEESVNGRWATVLWGIQFWQPYLVIGFLLIGLSLRKNVINRNNYLFLGLTLLMALLTSQMLLWPLVSSDNPLWGLAVPVHSSNRLHFALIPFLGIISLPLGAFFAKNTYFETTTPKELFGILLPGIIAGTISVIGLALPTIVGLLISGLP